MLAWQIIIQEELSSPPSIAVKDFVFKKGLFYEESSRFRLKCYAMSRGLIHSDINLVS